MADAKQPAGTVDLISEHIETGWCSDMNIIIIDNNVNVFYCIAYLLIGTWK